MRGLSINREKPKPPTITKLSISLHGKCVNFLEDEGNGTRFHVAANTGVRGRSTLPMWHVSVTRKQATNGSFSLIALVVGSAMYSPGVLSRRLHFELSTQCF